MSLKLFDVANFITICLSCILVVLSAVNAFLLRTMSRDFRVLAIYIIACCTFDLASWGLSLSGTENIVMLPLFNAVELLLFCLFFSRQLQSRLPYLLLAGGLLTGTYDLLHSLKEAAEYINLGRAYNAVGIISLVFVQMFRNVGRNTRLARLHYGMIFYFSVTFVHFLMLNFLITVPSELKFVFWMIYAVSCAVFYCMITLFLWKNRLS